MLSLFINLLRSIRIVGRSVWIRFEALTILVHVGHAHRTFATCDAPVFRVTSHVPFRSTLLRRRPVDTFAIVERAVYREALLSTLALAI